LGTIYENKSRGCPNRTLKFGGEYKRNPRLKNPNLTLPLQSEDAWIRCPNLRGGHLHRGLSETPIAFLLTHLEDTARSFTTIRISPAEIAVAGFPT